MMQFMKRLRILVLAALSGILLPLALPNEVFTWGNPAIGLIALAPLYIALALSDSYRMAWLASALFGGLAHAFSSYWLWFFHDFRFWTLGTSTLAYMVIYGCFGLYLRGALRKAGLLRVVAFAAVWVLGEWGKSNGFLGYPWGLLGYSWNTILPAIQIAESTGVYGLSFTLILVSAAIGELLSPAPVPLVLSACDEGWQGGTARILPGRPVAEWSVQGQAAARVVALGHLVIAIVLLAAVLSYGFMSLKRPRVTDRSFDAILVQQNMDAWEASGSEAEALSTSIRLVRSAISTAGRNPDVILLSETSLRRPWDEFRGYFARTPQEDPLIPLLGQTGAWLFTGLPEILDWERFTATNSVALINPQGYRVGSYAKMHPVPFAEAIPFWEYDGFRRFIQQTVGLESGWVMGTERIIFDLPTRSGDVVRFAAPICFEDAFAYLCRLFVLDGAELFINLTNDAWSRTDSAQIQHFVAARFRSVEARRVLVRSTNGGLSGIVLPDGSVRDLLPMFEATSRMVNIPVYSVELTPYIRWGDWFVATLAVLLGLLLVMASVGRACGQRQVR
jgi:apolipoprotein N-acyltransferase